MDARARGTGSQLPLELERPKVTDCVRSSSLLPPAAGATWQGTRLSSSCGRGGILQGAGTPWPRTPHGSRTGHARSAPSSVPEKRKVLHGGGRKNAPSAARADPASVRRPCRRRKWHQAVKRLMGRCARSWRHQLLHSDLSSDSVLPAWSKGSVTEGQNGARPLLCECSVV